jgi:uncharacterized iron-regulated membrane protein
MKVDYILDPASIITFIGGLLNGNEILMILGGLASIAAIINHADQWYQRRKNKK